MFGAVKSNCSPLARHQVHPLAAYVRRNYRTGLQQLCVGAPNSFVFGAEPFITSWRDLSGNGNHLTSLYSAPNQPRASFEVGKSAALRSVAADASSLVLPSAIVSSAAYLQWLFVYDRQATSAIQTFLRCDSNDLNCTVNAAGSMLFYVTTGNYGYYSAGNNTAMHVQTLTFNGDGADNAGRLQVRQDSVNQSLTFTGTIPAAIPTIASSVLTYSTNPSSIRIYAHMLWRHTSAANLLSTAQLDDIAAFVGKTIKAQT